MSIKNKIYFINSEKYIPLLSYKENVFISKQELKKFNNIFYASLIYISPITNFEIIKLKLNSKNTLLFSDGIIEWNNMFKNKYITDMNLTLYHPIIHDIFMCVGQDECEYFKFLGVNTVQFLPNRMKPTLKRIGKVKSNVFLITTANNAYFTESEQIILSNLLISIKEELDSNNYKYIFRIFDKFLIEKLNLNDNNNYTHGTFEECLQIVDFVITTPSSISFTSMFHGKPLAHLIYRDTPQFIQAGWNISSLTDLSQTLISMMSFDEDRMLFQEFQVKKYNTDNNHIDEELSMYIKNKKDENFKKFIDQTMYNMLNSKFNINFEFLFRKLYLKIKKNRFLQYIKYKIR